MTFLKPTEMDTNRLVTMSRPHPALEESKIEGRKIEKSLLAFLLKMAERYWIMKRKNWGRKRSSELVMWCEI